MGHAKKIKNSAHINKASRDELIAALNIANRMSDIAFADSARSPDSIPGLGIGVSSYFGDVKQLRLLMDVKYWVERQIMSVTTANFHLKNDSIL